MDTPLTIIATTDFSSVAHNAAHYAAALCKATDAQLLLFHAFSLPLHSANSTLSAVSLQNQIDKASEKLAEFADKLSGIYGISTTSVCNYSFFEEQLPLLIAENNAALVVMGMAEKSLEQDLIGNATTAAIKNVIVPLLAVPINACFQNAKKILFACDTFKPLSIRRLSWLREAVNRVGLEIEIFNVDKSVDHLKSNGASVHDSIEEEFQKVKYLYKSVRSNAVVSEIQKEIKLYGADILVMMPERYGFWDSLVHRSKTRMMASGLDIPLLSIPNL